MQRQENCHPTCTSHRERRRRRSAFWSPLSHRKPGSFLWPRERRVVHISVPVGGGVTVKNGPRAGVPCGLRASQTNTRQRSFLQARLTALLALRSGLTTRQCTRNKVSFNKSTWETRQQLRDQRLPGSQPCLSPPPLIHVCGSFPEHTTTDRESRQSCVYAYT